MQLGPMLCSNLGGGRCWENRVEGQSWEEVHWELIMSNQLKLYRAESLMCVPSDWGFIEWWRNGVLVNGSWVSDGCRESKLIKRKF